METAINKTIVYLERCRNKTGHDFSARMLSVRNTLQRLDDFVNIKPGKIADFWNPKIEAFTKRLDALK